MDYEFVHYGLCIRPKWIIRPSNMEYSFVQNGMQMNFFDLFNAHW